VDRGSKALEELPPFTRVGSEGLEEMVEDGRSEGLLGESLKEVDGRDKVIGTLPRASGSRPTFLAVVTLNSSASCVASASVLGRGVEVTHCDVDEGPSGNSRHAGDVERVPSRT